jgi:hypothetical protein
MWQHISVNKIFWQTVNAHQINQGFNSPDLFDVGKSRSICYAAMKSSPKDRRAW